MSGPNTSNGRETLVVGRLLPELAAAIVGKYGDNRVEVEIRPKPDLSPGDYRTKDSSPFYGGATLSNLHTSSSTTGICSSAFAWVSSGTYPLLSAGHCAPGGDAHVSTPATPDMGEIDSGSRESYNVGVGSVPLTGHNNLIGDVSLIRMHGSYESWARVWRTSSSSESVFKIWDRYATYHDQYCTSGQTSGETCGWEVGDIDRTIHYPNSEDVAPVVVGYKYSGGCGRHGDSGGAIYTVHSSGLAAKGIYSGQDDNVTTASFSNPCTEFFTDIHYPIIDLPGTVKVS